MIHHQELRSRYRRRRRRRVILVAVLLLILYFVIGTCAPFVYLRPTGTGSGALTRYLSDSEGSERVTLVESNVQALELRLKLIAEADEEILLTTYEFKAGASSDALAAAMLDAADRGVRVRILVDGLCGLTNMEGRDFFTALATHPSIEIRLYNRFNPLLPWKMSGRLHDKMFVIDSEAYIVGGRNTWDRFLGDYGVEDESIDRELLVVSTEADATHSIHSLRAYFDRLWESDPVDGFRLYGAEYDDPDMVSERERIRRNAYTDFAVALSGGFSEWALANTVATDRVTLITGEIGIYGKSPEVWSEMKMLMLSARERVVIQSPYFVCSKYMYRDLAEVASGASLTLVTNSVLNTDNKFTPADYLYHQDDLLATGASIMEYTGEKSSHAKTVLIDDSLVLIGSFNVDMRSAYMATELMVAVDSEALAQMVSESFDALLDESIAVGEGTTVDVFVDEMSLWRKVWHYVFGVILHPFRFEL